MVTELSALPPRLVPAGNTRFGWVRVESDCLAMRKSALRIYRYRSYSSDKAAELVIAARSILPEYLERAVQLDGIARVVVA